MLNKMFFYGIDPGYDRFGIAVVDKKKPNTLVYSDCFLTKKNHNFEKRLLYLSEKLEEIFSLYPPVAVAIEKVYFSKNIKTANKVAEIVGVVKLLSIKNKAEIYELTPQQIKLATTGYGKADKISVQKMVCKLYNFNKKALDDEFDAIATVTTLISLYKYQKMLNN